MLFNSLPFVVFFFFLFLMVRAAPKRFEAAILLGASLIFYTMWHPVYLLLLGAVLCVNYFLMWLMLKRSKCRICLMASIVFTLSLLGWFKYSAMVIETLHPVLRDGFGLHVQVPEFFLPLGISFYSFQIIALTLDLYRGHVKELPSFSRYVLFISFFPQLIAGPIVRGRELLPQLERGGAVTSERSRRGVWLLCSGLIKKVVMGDFLMAGFVDEVFQVPGVGAAGVHLIGMYAFAFQIYFDFSGYTDMARGLGCLLGFELPMNFKEPYLAVNPNDFWRRWHITLTTWFRDYVFVPLSVSRAWRRNLYINLMITWTLVGLWHGADWHFVIWGVYHAVLLSVYRLCRPLLVRVKPTHAVSRQVWSFVRWFVTFQLVCIGLLLFRTGSVAEALAFLRTILVGSYADGLPPLETLIVLASLGLHWVEWWIRRNEMRLQEFLAGCWWGSLLEGATVGAVVALALAASGSGGEFIYFQF